MASYKVFFTVQGRGPFPWDMLRYDGCHPVDGHSAAAIGASREDVCGYGTRRVRLVTRNVMGYTAGRWSSFGWTVLENPHAVDSPDDLPRREKDAA